MASYLQNDSNPGSELSTSLSTIEFGLRDLSCKSSFPYEDDEIPEFYVRWSLLYNASSSVRLWPILSKTFLFSDSKSKYVGSTLAIFSHRKFKAMTNTITMFLIGNAPGKYSI